MDFGFIPATQLDQVDFLLPGEPAGNAAVLAAAKSVERGHGAGKTKLYIGCPTWGRKEWIGKIYPQGTRDGNFLDHYVRQFNAVELNATHYKIYTPDEIRRWAEKAGDRPFRFCPKFPQSISHHSNLTGVETLTTAFLDGVSALGDHIGPVFLQLSDQFAPTQGRVLFDFLRTLPAGFVFFLEVRHPDWFLNARYRQAFFERLRELGIGVVITDTAGRRECAHMELTTARAFVCFVAYNLHPTDYSRVDAWVDRIRCWAGQGLQELYFFTHMRDELDCPDLVAYLAEKLTEAGLPIQPPELISSQGSLF